MSEDWKPGDLAVCVDDRPCWCCGDNCGLRSGVIYTVEAVRCDPGAGVGLMLRELQVPADDDHFPAFGAQRFRKVRPDQHKPCEEEFATLLNRTKRRVGA